MSGTESFGGSGDADDRALDAVASLIQELQPGSMVQRFVLIVETIADDGRWLSTFTAPDQKRWDSLGMLSYATAIESNVSLAPGRDDDGD